MMDTTQNNTGLEQKILTEQIRLLYRSIYVITLANMLVGLALVLGLWNLNDQRIMIFWVMLLLILQVVRFLVYLRYRKSFKPETAQKFANYFVITSGLSGCIWGSGGVLLFPQGELSYQLFLVMTLIGWGAGAVTTQHSYLKAFYAYFFPLLIPVTILLFTGDITHISLGVMLTAFIIAISYYARGIYHSLQETLKLRFENVELVEQLREQKDEAERANLAKSKFLAAASHDLRQPLHALSLFTSVLNDSTQSTENRKVVRQIDSSVQALEALFNALLDISRLDAGTMKVDRCHFSLQPIIDRLRNDFEPQAHEKNIKLVLPVCTDVVHSDPALLEQILRNFVSNAIRYTESGEVRIRCTPVNGKLLIDVRDTGIGIPAEEQERIFDEFHQLNNPERDRSKGLGLGLAIVKRTADLLGHAIDVQSTSGNGSVFSITVETGDPEKVTEDIKPAINDPMQSTHEALFVVIDDEKSVRAGMQERLQLWGYRVISATDLDEAIAQLRQSAHPPDGIIADYRLRNNRTGIEAIKALHIEFGSDIPALIITGDTAADKLREVNDSGYQILHKPVAPAKLRTFLRNALKKG